VEAGGGGVGVGVGDGGRGLGVERVEAGGGGGGGGGSAMEAAGVGDQQTRWRKTTQERGGEGKRTGEKTAKKPRSWQVRRVQQ
jgi:hypothetical protein